METIAVVIATFNRRSLLPRAIRSALAQLPAAEVIVVDDGSTDGTENVASGFGDQIRYMRQGNRERGVARNRGVAETDADLVAFLDSDDEFLPGHLARLGAALADDAGTGLAYDEAEFVSPSGDVFHVAPTRPVQGECFLEIARQNRFAFSSTMVRRELFEAVGGFVEDRTLSGAEDWELWTRLAAAAPIAHVPSRGVRIHFHGANSVADADAHEAAVLEAARRIHAHPRATDLGKRDRRALWAGLAVTRAGIRRSAGDAAGARRRLTTAIVEDPAVAFDRSVLRALATSFLPR